VFGERKERGKERGMSRFLYHNTSLSPLNFASPEPPKEGAVFPSGTDRLNLRLQHVGRMVVKRSAFPS